MLENLVSFNESDLEISMLETYKFTKIESFEFKGKIYDVKTFTGLLVKLCEVIYDNNKERFDDILTLGKGRTTYFSRDIGKFWRPHIIRGTSIYVETHFNKDKIVEICYDVIKLFGYSTKDFKINNFEDNTEDTKNIVSHHVKRDRQFLKYASKKSMEDKIKGPDLRAKIYEIISGLSKKNYKCNEWYLRNDLTRKGYNKGEIYQALKLLKEKGIIYDIPYLDWFISIEYREKDNIGENTLQKTILTIIKNFSIKFNWKYGIKQSDLFDRLIEKNFTEAEIRSALNILREREIIYKKVYVYWFTKDYGYENIVPKHTIEEDISEEDISEEEIPKEIEKDIKKEIEKDIKRDIPKETKDIKKDAGTNEDNMENNYSDIPRDAEDLTKRWNELKSHRDKLIQDREKEIVQQKELEIKREESINKQKELDTKISDLDKEKDRLKKLFDSIRLEINAHKKAEEKKGI